MVTSWAWAVPLVSVVVGAVLATLFSSHRDRRRNAFELKAAAIAWTRDRRYEAHTEVIGKLQEMQRQLDEAFLARRRGDKKVATPWLDIASVEPLRARLAAVAGQESLEEIDHAVMALLAERRALAAGYKDSHFSGMVDVSSHATIRSYIEYVRLELGQPVPGDDEISDRMLASSGRAFAAERKAEKAREVEAAFVAGMRC